jgi:hypothetical protein
VAVVGGVVVVGGVAVMGGVAVVGTASEPPLAVHSKLVGDTSVDVALKG